MNATDIIQSQMLAALDMLKQAIVKCPAGLWNLPGEMEECWRKAYHALYYAHLYLQKSEQHFMPWEKHHEPDNGAAFSQAEVLEYLTFVQQQVAVLVPTLDLNAPSGFDWLPFNKLELQFYNIRHIQQHAGELYERLGQSNIDLDWVSSAPTQ
jgi:hypothetical protein